MTREPIAIVGIGCRFPGAAGPEGFWRLLREGREAISEVPADRFNLDSVYDPRPGVPGKIYSRWGGFLNHVDQFDPYFFGIAPREAASMDPQHRLLLEVAWEGLEDAGQVPERLAGQRVGVFVGMCTNDYGNLLTDPADVDIYFAAGNARSILSGRVSYALGLEGPSVVLDTACSTSLVAVHLACQSLRSGESSLAVAGGVNLVLVPEPSLGFCQAQMLARDGRCKAFDASGDGFVRSDGVGIIVLKPLSKALADGDPVYAVIRGSAVNNDGRSGGLLMTPSRLGQEAVLREAYRDAAASPGDVQYVEAHGTGTSVGDPIEAMALGTVLASGRPENTPCRIGSVKTNIGHAEGAAGIAGLIKVALSMKHGVIPASLHFREPNPDIPWNDLPLAVQRELTPWPDESRLALAGVSSFGISGTNAHIVLEQVAADSHAQSGSTCKAKLLPVSGHTPEALRSMAEAYRELMIAETTSECPSTLDDVCYTASLRRTHHDHRLALVVQSSENLIEQLDAFLEGESRRGVISGRRIPDVQRKIVFAFPGQGSQWIGMAQQLLEQEPAFREAMEQCDAAMRVYVAWSLIDEILADESHSRLGELDVVQPVLCAVQVGLATLWRAWGVEPDAVVGHSMGEVAAAYIAGILTLDDAARVICRRSQVVKRRASGKGGMAVLDLAPAAVESLLAPYGGRLAIAACNGPSTTVISGDTDALHELGAFAERQEIFFQFVKVDYASHSPQMDELQEELFETLGDVRPRHASVKMLSTVGGTSVLDGSECDTSYWVRNLREPVIFSQAVRELARDGHDIFLEMSAHPTIAMAISHCLREDGRTGTILPSMRRGEGDRDVMLESLGALYTLGHPVDWSRQHPSGGRVVPLPSYTFQREHFWLADNRTTTSFAAQRGRPNGHPLLGQYFKSAAHLGTHFWESHLSTRSLPYLNDHRVQGVIVLPAAAYAEMTLAAAGEAFGPGTHVLRNLSFQKALFLADDQAKIVQLVLTITTPGEASVQFFSVPTSELQSQGGPTLHVTGSVRLARTETVALAPEHESVAEIQSRCLQTVSGPDFYRTARERALEYGPSFQAVEQIWRCEGEAIARLRPTKTIEAEAKPYHIHPALLDACFQALAAALPMEDAGTSDGSIFLPVGLETLRLYDRPGTGLWSHALLRSDLSANGAANIQGDVVLCDEDGRVVLEALGFSLQRLGQDSALGKEPDLDDWLYEIEWQPKARSAREQGSQTPAADQAKNWLIFMDEAGTGQALRGLLEAAGDTCIIVTPGERFSSADPGRYEINPSRPEEFKQLIAEVSDQNRPLCSGVVLLWGADASPSGEATLSSIEAIETRGCTSALNLVQALAEVERARVPRLWLVTLGAQAVGERIDSLSIAQSPLWGLGRVIAVEHPELRCTKVDLSPPGTTAEIQALAQELRSEDEEDQIALRGEERWVPRVVRCSPQATEETRRLVSADDPFRLEIATPGLLDKLTLRTTTRKDPGPGQIEIRVSAVGLNFRDILVAMGLIPPVFENSLDLGWECAGTIVGVGENVEGLRVGDEVVALAAACLGSFVTTDTALVALKPPHLSFEEAVTIPITFMTAYYALHHLGRLSKGERVLIHAAAGGVGQAAVQIAQKAGAEVFATAGSPEKRELLRSQGVRHVMDSRSLDFAEEVMTLTNGEGVDVVLNSLSGEFIPKSLSTLRGGGRFLEIGMVDILQNSPLGLRHFQNNLSFFAVNLAQMFLSRASFCGSMLAEVLQQFSDEGFKPLPFQVFPISEAADAFRYMAQAKHIGKVVISVHAEEEVLVAPSSDRSIKLSAEGTYLITGGLGGLGLSLAQWMVQRGARHLVLMGRSGVSSPAVADVIDTMRRQGTEVVVARADVAREQEVASVLDELRRSMPPLKGIVHAAAVLDDGILLQLNEERFRTVMAPKASGAWNLHSLTRDMPLDFFVMFSSAASVLASPGQGTYVAANAFLDSLAHYRRALGLTALTINWGLWAQVGLAARPEIARRLMLQGILPFSPTRGMQLMERLLQRDATQVMAISLDWSKLLGLYSPPFLSVLAAETQSSGPAKPKRTKDGLTREKLLAVDPSERHGLIEKFLTEQIARVLRCSVSKVDVHQPLTKLGIDSLMAVELKNLVEIDLEMTLPVTVLLQGPSLAQLSARLTSQLAGMAPSTSAAPAVSIASGTAAPALIDPPTPEQLLATVDELPDEAVDSLLRELMAEGVDTARENREEFTG